jgi:O-antigen/teichoic acid export membrane protein
MDSPLLIRRTFHAVIWALVRIGSSNLLGFVLFMVLARILSPGDFGTFALAALLTDIARLISTAGLNDAVTRDTGASEDLADTAFWTSLILGGLFGLLMWIFAPAYASLLHQPEAGHILRYLAALPPVASLGAIHTARKLKDFGHKSLAARTIGGGILGGGAAIIAAMIGFGVWSLVVQAMVVEVVGVLFAWQSYPWLPRWNFDVRRLRTVLALSGTLMFTQLMALLQLRLQDLLIGRYISVSAVGGYRVAWRLIDLLSQMTVQPIVSVSFVTFSHLQTEADRFRTMFLQMVGIGATLAIPVIWGFGALSPDLIPHLFGQKWEDSVGIVQVLSLMAVPLCMNAFLYSALGAIGRPSAMAKSTTAQFAIVLLLSPIAAHFGVLWVAAVFVLRGYLTLPYNIARFQHETGIRFTDVLGAIAPPTGAALVMAIALTALAPVLRTLIGHTTTYLICAVFLGAAIYGLILMLAARDHVRSNFAAFAPFLKRGRPDLDT